MMKKLLIIILIGTIIQSCNPHLFTLNEMEDIEIYGLIMSDIGTVEVPAKYKNVLTLKENSRVALASSKLTQFISYFSVKVIKGNGLIFSFRTVSDTYEKHPSIQFKYDKSGSFVYNNKKLINSVDSIKAIKGKEKLISISNNGQYYQIIVDCDTVHKGRTILPATEYIIIECLEGTQANISGIEFAETYNVN